jgi:hypothetical protein
MPHSMLQTKSIKTEPHAMSRPISMRAMRIQAPNRQLQLDEVPVRQLRAHERRSAKVARSSAPAST